jgi:hypothetical protein
MAAVVGYLVAAGVAIVIAWFAAGRGHAASRDASVDLAEIGGRHVPILGGLAGFAVTGMVLLVTLGRDLPEASGTSFTTLLTMFFVAYMGFFGTSLMFANIPDPEPSADFDVPGAAFAGAAVTLWFTVAIGWLALRPLFETFGLERLAELAGWLVAASTIASYGLVSRHLYQSGFVSARMTATMLVVAVTATLVYALLAAWFGLRSPDSTLALTVSMFIIAAPAYALLTALPIIARQERLADALARNGRVLILGYAQGAVVFVGFLLLSILGFA